MRVLLVNTNRIRPPIAPVGLDYLGAALRGRGHDVELLDLCLANGAVDNVVAAAVRGREIRCVAVSFRNTDDCYFASGVSFVPVLRRDIEAIRRNFDGPVVVGGGGFSLMPEGLLDATGGDYGVVGDGEEALVRFADLLEEETGPENVPGLVWRRDGSWVANEAARTNVSGMDVGARDLVDNSRYFRRGGQIGIETKRGCPGACIYCADPVVKGAVSRVRNPGDVVAEMRNLLAQGIDCFHLCDSEFNVPVSHAEAVCRAICDSGLGKRIQWYAYCSPVPFPGELAKVMVDAGCVGIDFGADHGSDMQLHRLGRGFTKKDLRETAEVCRHHGMVFMYDLLLGAPGDSRETVRETIDLMREIGPHRVGVSLGVRVYPGTPLARQAGNGLLDATGFREGSDDLSPVYYVSPDLGNQPLAFVCDLVGDDDRFLMPCTGDTQDYNYNDNTVLQEAIDAGARGAYWDILRRLGRGP